MEVNRKCPLVGGVSCVQRSGAIFFLFGPCFLDVMFEDGEWKQSQLYWVRLCKREFDCKTHASELLQMLVSCPRSVLWCQWHVTFPSFSSGWEARHVLGMSTQSGVIRVAYPQIHFSKLPGLTSECVSDLWVTRERHIEGVGGGGGSHTYVRKLGANTPRALLQPY
jgi:hypothetical protein